MKRHLAGWSIAAVLAVTQGAPAQAIEQGTPQTTHPAGHGGAHQEHDMLIRGSKAMGFDQLTTTHRFLLRPEGGAIEITANDPADAAAIQSIRRHLEHIQGAFAAGDFSLPVFIHAAEPPGAAVLRERRAHLQYAFEEIEKGGRLTIRTSDAAARGALHAFLRFQITEHKTGDPRDPK